LVILLAFVGVLVGPLRAEASPESRELVRQGAQTLAQGTFPEALGKFEVAAQADPSDGEAIFFQGVALNRLGRHADALTQLHRALGLGATHPDMEFEVGWSLVALGQWRAAIAVLERYEASAPGRGQTSEFLGRAYLGARDLDRAEAKLKEAIQRDPALRPTALFFLAAVEEARGLPGAARERLGALLRDAPEAPLTRALIEQLSRLAPPPTEKPWSLVVSSSGGFNSNVIALGDRVPLPAGISSKRSGFARFTLNASYDWRLAEAATLTGGYGLLADVYENVSNFDLLDHFFYLDYRHAFTRDLAVALRLSDELTLVGGSSFRNQVGLRPALSYRLLDWAVTEVAYSFAWSDYFFSVPSVQDRDGITHTVAWINYLLVPGTQLQARLGYFHTWSNADGGDFDYRTNGLVVGLSHPLPWRITGEVSYTRTFDRYDNPNSLAGATGFGFRRKDDVDTITVQLVRPLLESLRVYARYDFITADSNIQFFNFKQHVWSFGFVASF
jgi:tetratricopeptide (TPR) repeat protein